VNFDVFFGIFWLQTDGLAYTYDGHGYIVCTMEIARLCLENA